MSKEWSNLSKIVYRRTYSRRKADTTLENWNDTIERVVAGNVRGHNVPDAEVKQLLHYMKERKAGPAGRGYWFSGTDAHYAIGGVALNNCFGGDTKFLSEHGLVKMRDWVGRSISVPTSDLSFHTAKVRSFGEQPLNKITLVPSGIRSSYKIEYEATPRHRWLTTDGETTDLQVGDKISVKRHSFNYTDDSEHKEAFDDGFVHGLIFGDGTQHTNCADRYVIRLCGHKQSYLKALERSSCFVSTSSHESSDWEPIVTLRTSVLLKEKPAECMSLAYQRGFLQGWLSVDGDLEPRNGSVRLFSQDKDALDWVVSRSPLLGFCVTGYATNHADETNYGTRAEPLWTLTLTQKDVEYKVASIVATGRVEEVFCLTEPVTRSFMLEFGVVTGNCWFLTADDWKNFVTAQDLLMLGGGVGLSVEHRFVSALPKIRKGVSVVHKATKDADYIVPDSREGWCELLHRTLESYFVTGRSFTYSTVCVRGYGEPIAGFGGTASGPRPLVKFIETLSRILGAREGKHIRPVDGMDILCATGEMVVAGNVRRSAIIILGDCWDKEYLKAKRWDLGSIPTYRSCANLSVVCDDIEDLHPLFWKTYEAGEPFGLVNRKNIQRYGRVGEFKKDTALGVNPCVVGSTEILTDNGYFPIETLVGEQVNVWNGFEWSKVTPKVTGYKQPVVNVLLSSGQSLTCTPSHEFVLALDYKGTTSKVKAVDLQTGDKLLKVTYPVVDVGEDCKTAYTQGFISGDGMDGYSYVQVYEPKYDCLHRLDIKRVGDEVNGRRVCHLNFTPFSKAFVPMAWSVKARLDWLSGLLDADGCVLNEGGIQLCSVDLDFLTRVQKMLTTLGVLAKVVLRREKEERPLPDGRGGSKLYPCQQLYGLCIGSSEAQGLVSLGLKTERLKIEGFQPNRSASRFVTVVDVVPAGEADAVYCFTEPLRHLGCFDGIVTGQCAEANLESFEPCNLQNIPLMNIDSEQEFETVARLMHRYGKRVTMEKYHIPQVQEVISRNRRIGTSLTGCLGSPLFNPATLDRVYAAIQEENVKYSAEKGIPESIRTTTLNPGGTVSKMHDQNGYEGIHAAYAAHIIQRVRFAANDALLPLLRAAGHRMEPVVKFDGSVDPGTMVVDFYVKAPEGMPVADEDWDTWKQLDVLLMAQKHWADQAVSATVYYKREDIPKLKQWLAENLQYLKTISFLCHGDHGFKQAPKEKITAEQFEKLSAKIKPIEFEQVGEGDMESLECASGSCPIR